MAQALWGQNNISSYLRASRVEVADPLNGTPSIIFHLDQAFLNTDGSIAAMVSAGSMTLTQDHAAIDPVLGPLALTLSTTLDAIAQALWTASQPPSAS